MNALLKNRSLNPYSLIIIYTGYAGCGLECPVTLHNLNTVEKVKSGEIPFFFIDLLSTETSEVVNFAERFNPKFNTLPLSNEAKALINELDIIWKKIHSDNIQITHTDRIYLIEKQKERFTLLNHYTGSSANMPNHLQETLQTYYQNAL